MWVSLQIIRYLSLYVWEHCKTASSNRGLDTQRPLPVITAEREQMSRAEPAPSLWGLRQDPPQPCSTAYHSAGNQHRRSQPAHRPPAWSGCAGGLGEIRKWNKNKDGKQLQRMKERRGPEQKLKLGHALYEGGLQQNELVPSLTLKRGNWEQNALFLLSCLGGLAPSWICCCDGSPVPACLPARSGCLWIRRAPFAFQTGSLSDSSVGQGRCDKMKDLEQCISMEN